MALCFWNKEFVVLVSVAIRTVMLRLNTPLPQYVLTLMILNSWWKLLNKFLFHSSLQINVATPFLRYLVKVHCFDSRPRLTCCRLTTSEHDYTYVTVLSQWMHIAFNSLCFDTRSLLGCGGWWILEETRFGYPVIRILCSEKLGFKTGFRNFVRL